MKKVIFLMLILLVLPLAFATPNEAVEDLSDAVFEPLFETIRPLFVKLSFVVGGIFGAYVILIILRVYYEHRNLKMLKAIKFNLDQSNKAAGIRYSSQKKGIMDNFLEYWRAHSHSKALKKIDKLQKDKTESKDKNEN
jgi:hypothetical protein